MCIFSENQEDEEVDSENPDYEDDYVHSTTTTVSHIPITTTLLTTTTTTTKKPLPTTTFTPTSLPRQPPSGLYLNPSQSPPSHRFLLLLMVLQRHLYRLNQL